MLGLITLIFSDEKQRLVKMQRATAASERVTEQDRAQVRRCLQRLHPWGLNLRPVSLSFTTIVGPFVFYKPQMCPLTIQLRVAL